MYSILLIAPPLLFGLPQLLPFSGRVIPRRETPVAPTIEDLPVPIFAIKSQDDVLRIELTKEELPLAVQQRPRSQNTRRLLARAFHVPYDTLDPGCFS